MNLDFIRLKFILVSKMRTKTFIAITVVILGICGCEEITSSMPQMPPPIPGATLLTAWLPAEWEEKEAKLAYADGIFFYITENQDDSVDCVNGQELNSDYAWSWLASGYPGWTSLSQLKVYPDNDHAVVVWSGYKLTRESMYSGDRVVLSAYGSQGVHPRISPDGYWVAYVADYGQGGIFSSSNVYIVDNLGEIAGEVRQVTNFQNQSYYDISVRPVCWLSDHELVVKKKSIDYGLRFEMLKYDINNLTAPPVLLTTTIYSQYRPMGYDEVVYVPGDFYITNCGNAGFRFANMYKCPLGVAGDYGQQLTFGGNFDLPCDISPDGTKLLFIRFYRYGSNYLTGESDIYLMDLNSLELSQLTTESADDKG